MGMDYSPEIQGTGNYCITICDSESREDGVAYWVLEHGFHSVEEAARNLDRCAEERDIPSEKLSIIRIWHEDEAQRIKNEVAE